MRVLFNSKSLFICLALMPYSAVVFANAATSCFNSVSIEEPGEDTVKLDFVLYQHFRALEEQVIAIRNEIKRNDGFNGIYFPSPLVVHFMELTNTLDGEIRKRRIDLIERDQQRNLSRIKRKLYLLSLTSRMESPYCNGAGGAAEFGNFLDLWLQNLAELEKVLRKYPCCQERSVPFPPIERGIQAVERCAPKSHDLVQRNDDAAPPPYSTHW